MYMKQGYGRYYIDKEFRVSNMARSAMAQPKHPHGVKRVAPSQAGNERAARARYGDAIFDVAVGIYNATGKREGTGHPILKGCGILKHPHELCAHSRERDMDDRSTARAAVMADLREWNRAIITAWRARSHPMGCGRSYD
jgi:hypothetical protein